MITITNTHLQTYSSLGKCQSKWESMLTFITIWGGTWSLFLSCLTSIREGMGEKEGEEGRGGKTEEWGRLVTEWLSGGRIGAKGETHLWVSPKEFALCRGLCGFTLMEDC